MWRLIFVWGASSCSEEIMMRYLNNPAAVISAIKKSSASLFLQKKIKCLIISSVKKSSASVCFQQIGGVSILLQKKMRRLIISSEKNQHFFLKKYWGTCFFSDEIMRHLIFFWRNSEVLDFFIAEVTLAGLWGNKPKCLITS